MPTLQFQPIASQPSPDLWAALTALKLDKLKLDDSAQPIRGWLTEGRQIQDREVKPGEGSKSGGSVGIDGALSLGRSAFGTDAYDTPAGSIPCSGVFKNFNTIEEFKSTDAKKAAFDTVVDSIVESFDDDDPELNPFLLVTFADLKKYVYHYWFAFPALVSKPNWEVDSAGWATLAEEDEAEIRALEGTVFGHNDPFRNGFLVSGARAQRSASRLSGASLLLTGSPDDCVVFHDPSSLPDSPGWPLRNILYYLSHRHGVRSIKVVCLRSGEGSRVGRVVLPANDGAGPSQTTRPQAVGWERNAQGKLASRTADLGPMMDPSKLADQAVDLNLKLMRWRILPTLDLEKVAGTKCLLLGAGTLGCYVARSLMGWGVRNITFVDSARVSFSNPVRQPLFDFEDCLDGGKPKAQCAADRLKRIFPGVNATAHSFLIPMPGHPIAPAAESAVAADVTKLVELVESHDVVFLLMDSRESRWLPTVLAASEGKVLINAALGFDSYLVMRHGGPAMSADDSTAGVPRSGERLGCYFCNDVVAPADSLTDRTLDQMCTVTRPGIAPIASASAVELLVSLLQHPLGLHAPHSISSDSETPDSTASLLGAVPHQIRGQLSAWKNTLVHAPAFEQCTACSAKVVSEYRDKGFDMLRRVFNEGDYLEKLTGLDELQRQSEALLEDVEWEGSEGDDDF